MTFLAAVSIMTMYTWWYWARKYDPNDDYDPLA